MHRDAGQSRRPGLPVGGAAPDQPAARQVGGHRAGLAEAVPGEAGEQQRQPARPDLADRLDHRPGGRGLAAKAGLDLDVGRQAELGQAMQGLIEARPRRPAPQRPEPAAGVEPADGGIIGRRHRPAAVGGAVHELDPADAGAGCRLEAGDGVLRRQRRRAAMADQRRQPHGHESLSRTAGEGAERSEAGEGLRLSARPAAGPAAGPARRSPGRPASC